MKKLAETLAVASLLVIAIAPAAAAKDIKLGHLTYHSGQYAGFGPFFDGVTEFVVDEINQTPPLGRRVTAIHEDSGTVGEWRAVKKLLDKHQADIVLNVSHQYETYRNKLLKRIAFLKKPLIPSVHGGSIDAAFGGIAEEPLFRGSPMDSAQSAAAMLHIKNSGKKTVVLVANNLKGHLLQMKAAQRSAERLGLTVLGSLVFQPNWTDYSSVVSQVALKKPDAVAVFSTPSNGGIFVKNAANAGHSWFLVGTSEWQERDFRNKATMEAIQQHQSVLLSAYANDDSPAWQHYKTAAEASEQIDVIGDVSNSYALQYYDLLVASALAIEKAGSLESSKWSKAMYEVTGGDGMVVYNYSDGINAIRAGKEINYDGVTGSMEFTETGVVAGLFGIFRWTDRDMIEQVAIADGDVVADLDQN
ncbi:MAG: ABC transporter substrate-binding protein [Granulosicoccus sp.]